MFIKFWGTRGSIPVPGRKTCKYGGNTPCVEIRIKDDEIIILDAGSGLRELGNYLQNTLNFSDIPILISHYHWDHIQGIPFFRPLFKKNNIITFYGLTIDDADVKSVLSNQMVPNHFPINISEFDAFVKFQTVNYNDSFNIKNVMVETYRSNHTADALTYKVKIGKKSLVYIPDNEILCGNSGKSYEYVEIEKLNRKLIEFCKECDYLIHDSMYDENTVRKKKGWGHSSNISLAYFSIIAKVKHLILFHYNPDYNDSKIDALIDETDTFLKKEKSNIICIGAQEGLTINF
ncbi:MAG TPA: MBL fold metallo-hydrolase [Ignavibacteria bacterium]|nr:MBL fold metallo-hydrolase [Ignavibacteria bacterium]